MEPAFTSTTGAIDGYRVVRSLGVVRGLSVRSRSIAGTVVGSFQAFVGGRNTVFTELAEETRAEAFDQMLAHAAERGANAVVAVRYDATGSGALTEVLCYGTAVVVEPAELSGSEGAR